MSITNITNMNNLLNTISELNNLTDEMFNEVYDDNNKDIMRELLIKQSASLNKLYHIANTDLKIIDIPTSNKFISIEQHSAGLKLHITEKERYKAKLKEVECAINNIFKEDEPPF